MAAIDFPSNPTLNQIFTSGNKSWQWDGVKWIALNTGSVVSSLIGTANQIDASASIGDVTLSLANSGVSASTYGSSSQVPVLTVDTKGRITSASVQNVSGGGGGEVISSLLLPGC